MRARSPWSLPTAIAFVCVILLSACARETPEAKMRRALDDAVAALAAKDIKGAGAILADDFTDGAKRTKKDLTRLGFLALQRGPVFVRLQSVSTEVEGARATTELTVLAVQGAPEIKSAADLLDTNARTLELTLRWRKDGGDWQVTHVEGLPTLSFE
ncbi:MAG: hypothetical protein IT383_06445 [Deltaproteobacteria bacterium]|nr:hypothetical protein [Deltaproteobacteria bacterium]